MREIFVNVLIVLSLSGCATAQNPDPLEFINRKTFTFNEKVDKTVLNPIAKGYKEVIPEPVRTSVSNFYANPRDLLSAISLFLQGRVDDGISDTLRFGANTIFGLLGFFDIATDLGYKKHNEDIGQALGSWGMSPGPYIVWPLFGPSSLRDTTTLISNILVSPQALVSDDRIYYTLSAIQVISLRSELLPATDILDEASLDKYLFVRDAYLSHRQALVYDGNPPPVDEDF